MQGGERLSELDRRFFVFGVLGPYGAFQFCFGGKADLLRQLYSMVNGLNVSWLFTGLVAVSGPYQDFWSQRERAAAWTLGAA